MSQSDEWNEAVVLERLRRLPPDKQQQVVDFMDFLESREGVRGWLEFDEWARNLAKEKGFSQLTEEDIARIVSDFRRGK